MATLLKVLTQPCRYQIGEGVLHFASELRGGKTEAYLGLAAWTIAHRRITNGGTLGAGVSVLMRYTLRLLTLDQLSRAAGVVCALELMRDEPAWKRNGK